MLPVSSSPNAEILGIVNVILLHFFTQTHLIAPLFPFFFFCFFVFCFCFSTSFSSSAASAAFVYTKTLHDCCWISPEDQREKPLLLSSSQSNAPPTLLAGSSFCPYFLLQRIFLAFKNRQQTQANSVCWFACPILFTPSKKKDDTSFLFDPFSVSFLT